MEAAIQIALGVIVGLVVELQVYPLHEIEKGLEDSGLVSRDVSGVNFKRRR